MRRERSVENQFDLIITCKVRRDEKVERFVSRSHRLKGGSAHLHPRFRRPLAMRKRRLALGRAVGFRGPPGILSNGLLPRPSNLCATLLCPCALVSLPCPCRGLCVPLCPCARDHPGTSLPTGAISNMTARVGQPLIFRSPERHLLNGSLLCLDLVLRRARKSISHLLFPVLRSAAAPPQSRGPSSLRALSLCIVIMCRHNHKVQPASAVCPSPNPRLNVRVLSLWYSIHLCHVCSVFSGAFARIVSEDISVCNCHIRACNQCVVAVDQAPICACFVTPMAR